MLVIFSKNRPSQKFTPHQYFILYGIMLIQLVIDSNAVVTLLLIAILHKF